MKNKHVLVAVLITYLVISFVPQIGLLSLISGLKGGSGKKL